MTPAEIGVKVWGAVLIFLGAQLLCIFAVAIYALVAR